MLIFALILLFYPIAVFAEDICKGSPYKKCPMPFGENFFSYISGQDIKDECPNMLTYIDCLGNYDATCGVPRKVFTDEGEYESIRALTVDICEESTLIHAVLTENIQCLKSAMSADDKNTCYGDKFELVKELSIPESEKESDDYGRPYSTSEMCFLEFYYDMCYVENVEKSCGTLVKDAVIEVLDRSFALRKSCRPEYAALFAEDVGKITKMGDSQKDIMREFAKQVLKEKDTVLPSSL